MKQDLNLRTRLFRDGAESAQLLHPSKLTPVCAKRLVFQSVSYSTLRRRWLDDVATMSDPHLGYWLDGVRLDALP